MEGGDLRGNFIINSKGSDEMRFGGQVLHFMVMRRGQKKEDPVQKLIRYHSFPLKYSSTLYLIFYSL